VSIVCIALMVMGGMTMVNGFLSSVDSTTLGLEEISQRDDDILRTSTSTLVADQSSADVLEVTLRNSGQTKLTEFCGWDVIVQYYDSGGGYHVKWLPYTTGAPGNNEWTTEGIYLDAGTETAEVFEPGILNPAEEMVILARLNPSVGQGTTNLVIISTPNGITASIMFSGYSP